VVQRKKYNDDGDIFDFFTLTWKQFWEQRKNRKKEL